MLQSTPNQRPLHPSLQAKMQLLQNLQKGNMQRVSELAYALSKVGNTNPELYGKLSMFVEQHKEQIMDCDSDDDDREPEIINVDGDFVQGKEWDSEDSIEYESEQEEDADKQNMAMKPVKKEVFSHQPSQKKELFKEVKVNCDRRSVSNKKTTSSTPNNTYQFKPSILTSGKKETENKILTTKPQVHRNSAIGKTKNTIQH